MCRDFGLVDPYRQALLRFVVEDGNTTIAVEEEAFEDGEVGLFMKRKSVLCVRVFQDPDGEMDWPDCGPGPISIKNTSASAPLDNPEVAMELTPVSTLKFDSPRNPSTPSC